jgi:hypothetical protein
MCRSFLILVLLPLGLDAQTDRIDQIIDRLDKTDKKIDTLFKQLQTDIMDVRKDVDDIRRKQSYPPPAPKQPPAVPQSSVRVENETSEPAMVQINEQLVEVGAKQTKFVTVPAGQFTYQIQGLHSKAILSELAEGQVYGLAVRAQKKKLAEMPQEQSKPPLPPKQDVPVKNDESITGGGQVTLYNKYTSKIVFRVNGKNYYVKPGSETLVRVPVGPCNVEFPGWSPRLWSYDVEEGFSARVGCTRKLIAPTYRYEPRAVSTQKGERHDGRR